MKDGIKLNSPDNLLSETGNFVNFKGGEFYCFGERKGILSLEKRMASLTSHNTNNQ